MMPQANIAILTVIPAELEAARSALKLAERPSHRLSNGTNYWEGEIYSYRCRQRVRIVLGCIGSAGNLNSAAATTEIISYCHPQVVLLGGIAAGMRKKIRIGEVALSERVVAYEPAAITVGPDKSNMIIPRPDSGLPENNINQDVVYYLSQSKKGRRLEAAFAKLGGVFPSPSQKKRQLYEKLVATAVSVRNSTMASGEKLLRNPNQMHYWQKNMHGKIEVAEMEASGLMTACRRAQVPWLVVRGISDFGDKFKDDAFHSFASTTAMVVLADFIRYGLYVNSNLPLSTQAVPKSEGASSSSIKVSARSGGIAIGTVTNSKVYLGRRR